MVNVSEFIEKQNHNSFYALVTYNGVTEPTYFYTVDLGEEGLLDLHSPCEIVRQIEGAEKIENYFNGLQEKENGRFSDKDIDECFKPLIVDNIYYEMENFQCAPYLPEEVDNIDICSERDCLLHILNNSSKD